MLFCCYFSSCDIVIFALVIVFKIIVVKEISIYLFIYVRTDMKHMKHKEQCMIVVFLAQFVNCQINRPCFLVFSLIF